MGPQPLIYMRGLKSADLTAIVDFIYLREASVFQEELESFLALAEELQLKGLDGSSEEKAPEYPKKSFGHSERRADLNPKQTILEKRTSTMKFEANTFEGTVMTYQQKNKTKLNY